VFDLKLTECLPNAVSCSEVPWKFVKVIVGEIESVARRTVIGSRAFADVRFYNRVKRSISDENRLDIWTTDPDH
jgi:hypothetical protein